MMKKIALMSVLAFAMTLGAQEKPAEVQKPSPDFARKYNTYMILLQTAQEMESGAKALRAKGKELEDSMREEMGKAKGCEKGCNYDQGKNEFVSNSK